MGTMNRSHDDQVTLALSAPVHPLVAYRRQKGLTQRKLAAQIGVARETVARWEAGRPIDNDFVARVADATGISRAELRPDLVQLLEGNSAAEMAQ